jgi:type I restriction enzyme S subunit
MMTENRDILAPQIRFKGFTDAWEQRKLGEVAEHFQYGLNASAKNYDGVHKYIRITDIDEDLRHFDESNLTSPDISFDGADDYLLKHGDILFARTGASVGKTYLHKNDNADVYFAGFLIRARFSDEHASEFIYQNTLTEKYYTFIKVMSQRSGQPGVNAQEYAGYSLGMPVIEEQQKLGSFFRVLDNTITLHQRKLDGLRELKRGYLQLMFPQAGERVPRVRFIGFSDEWAERRLVDVTERVQGNDGRMDLPTLTISAGSGWLDQRERFSNNIAGKEQENYTLLSKGELAYNKGNSKLAKYGVVFELKTFDEALVPRVYHSFRATQESNAAFLEYLFASKIPDNELAKLITSGARMDGLLNIGYEAFMGIIITVPTKDEQDAIADYFRSFDGQVADQQAKLDKLKQLKNAFLQKMFA